jgi:hypothetical protein
MTTDKRNYMLRFLTAAALLLSFMAAPEPAASQNHLGITRLLTQVSQTVDRCHKQCAPLLNLDSRSEAKRTYANCRALCAGNGSVTCPDGSKQSVNNPRCRGGHRPYRERWRGYR